MLKKTFCHIHGITAASEKLLWRNGIEQWDDFLEQFDQLTCLSKTKLDKIKQELPFSKKALTEKNLSYFKHSLDQREHWRLFDLGKAAYVDIETSGIHRDAEITVIGIYDGLVPYMYVNGKNLHEAHSKLLEFDTIVTFNGKQFDLPIIENHFSYNYDFVHLDLRFMLRELGLRGGLKSIEYQLGIQRDAEVEGIDGFEAVRLWHRYKRGDLEALQILLSYNAHDIINLKTLLEYYLKNKSIRFSQDAAFLEK